MSELDLRHLRIFLAVYAAGNVTRAADTVGLSQSSVSVVLAQLRAHYGDPLFVRTSDGMKPTPRAELLVPLARQALQLLEQSLVRSAAFNPAEITRTFRICMTDVGQMTLLPRLLPRVLEFAPNVRIEAGNLSRDTGRQLESGEADLALGFTEHLQAGFYRQKLFDEGFACIVARRHPRITDHVTLTQLKQERHVKVLLSATAHSIVDRILERQRIRRSFAATVPSFLGLGKIVASSELIAIVPLRLALIFAAESHVKIVTLPLRLPPYAVHQFWHDRYHRDAGNAWLRSVTTEIAMALPLAQANP
ncbi:transcriptional regulator, LysR family [Variovorax sp. YR752]|uniref:LysR family transcriptional regulator n=1 Tax=unclassified Variovorax TaxID=663243 RepID=UPI000BCE5433|nr:LysR family transcriptional regulator [Variovorax sp. YR752]SOE06311.1 transcriptional regulator, LysR family [Variovorax sp. YR752]